MPPLNNQWSAARKFGTLFATAYFFFLVMDFSSSDELFPHFVYVLMKPYVWFWDQLVPWTGKHILHLSYPITVKPNGSGDTTYNYVLQMLWLVMALFIALAWLLIDRKRKAYPQVAYWTRIVMRYYLAFMMFTYGFIKIIKLQFPSPGLITLTEPYGDSSPMGLAWTFIGYSKGYNIFIGSAEVIGGALLFFKRTTLFGALITMTVMMNVAAMNFAYDIPVKIFSVNLVVIAAWLALYDFKRLRNVFFLNRPVEAAPLSMPQPKKWKRILQYSLKILAVVFALYSTLWTAIGQSRQYGDAAPRPALFGIYNVESFSSRGDTLPPLTTDTVRWKQFIINYPGYVRVTTMADSMRWMKAEIDTVKKTARFTSQQDSTLAYAFRYAPVDRDHYLFESTDSHALAFRVKRWDETHFRLMTRGFHWINEYPYNR